MVRTILLISVLLISSATAQTRNRSGENFSVLDKGKVYWLVVHLHHDATIIHPKSFEDDGWVGQTIDGIKRLTAGEKCNAAGEVYEKEYNGSNRANFSFKCLDIKH